MSLSMFIIPGVIMLFTHLTTDKDFNDTYRNIVYIVCAILAVWYLISKIIL